MGGNEEKWIAHAKAGSRKAFDRLIRTHSARVFYFLYDMTGQYEDAQDLTQDVFMKAYQAIGRFRGDSKFSTWIYRIAYNVGVDYGRQKGKKRQVLLEKNEKEILQQTRDNRDPAEWMGTREAIDSAMQSLTEPQRMAVLMHHEQGFSMREVGDVLGCSESTARVHLFRGLQKLRKKLHDFSPGAE